MITERANAAINFPANAPSLLEALLQGGLSSEDATDRIDAHAAIRWAVYAVKRNEQLLTKLCASWGVKDP